MVQHMQRSKALTEDDIRALENMGLAKENLGAEFEDEVGGDAISAKWRDEVFGHIGEQPSQQRS